ncbi:bifunctional [glutamine synthetase] adenylyltransferase/[glutamine synthetase]-adenylyl-L-tyrosine phosphorylase, partial [Hansschlegelia beijingensis]
MAERTSRKRAASQQAMLAERLTTAPQAADREAAHERVNELLQEPNAAALAEMAGAAPARAMLEGIADGSSFLWGLISRDPERAARLLRCDPDERLAELLAELEEISRAEDRRPLAGALRKGRAEAAL